MDYEKHVPHLYMWVPEKGKSAQASRQGGRCAEAGRMHNSQQCRAPTFDPRQATAMFTTSTEAPAIGVPGVSGAPAKGSEFPLVGGVLVDGHLVDVLPRDYSPEEQASVAADTIIFEDRASLRYAEVIAFVTWKAARENSLLQECERSLLVYVCVSFRRALWIDGAAYTRIVGAVYDIDVGDAQPIAQHPYKKSPVEAGNCEWHLQKAVAMGILRPHVGSWATPAFVVKQKGKPRGRLVCDYRRVNAVTRRMYHPMPRVDVTLRDSAGARWYSGLDAVSGFNHLMLSDWAKEVFAICSASGLYAWESLPFGPADGPQAFQAAMRRLFDQVQYLGIYLDDLCLATRTCESPTSSTYST